ncbi:RNA polymerase sigma subunit RpoS (sigma-38) [Salmonella enterica subsp. enterica serovar Typhi]|nr:RNA polymerase sigma subunit RpoS (sigma-38) [Salmonella enterica subsp. enterica serovar Typhi]
MSQNTLKVHDLNEDAEFDENGVEAFDEKALSEEEPSDNDLAEEELLSQGATQRVLDATQLYLGEIGYSPLLTAEEEVYFARRAPHVSCRINWTTNRVRKKLQSNWINRLMTSAVCFVSTSALPR